MCYKWESAECQDLIERKKREEVCTECDTQCPSDRDREEEKEPRLVLLMVSTHVSDRVERSDDPKEGSY